MRQLLFVVLLVASAWGMSEDQFLRALAEPDGYVSQARVTLTRPVRLTQRAAIVGCTINYVGPPTTCVLTVDAAQTVVSSTVIVATTPARRGLCLTRRARGALILGNYLIDHAESPPILWQHGVPMQVTGNAERSSRGFATIQGVDK